MKLHTETEVGDFTITINSDEQGVTMLIEGPDNERKTHTIVTHITEDDAMELIETIATCFGWGIQSAEKRGKNDEKGN